MLRLRFRHSRYYTFKLESTAGQTIYIKSISNKPAEKPTQNSNFKKESFNEERIQYINLVRIKGGEIKMALIRTMHAEDIPQVQDVAKISWNTTYEGIIPLEIQEKFLKAAYNDERMKQRLERSFLFVAEIDSNIIGFANFSPVNEEGKAWGYLPLSGIPGERGWLGFIATRN